MRTDKKKMNRSQKEKKKIQKELTRKPRLVSIFAKYLCVVLVVATLTGIMGTYVARTLYVSHCRNRMQSLLEDGESNIKESYREAYNWVTPFTVGDGVEDAVVQDKDVIDAMKYSINYRIDRLCTSDGKEEGCLAVYYEEEKIVDSLDTIYSLARAEDVYQSSVSAHDVDGDSIFDGMFYTEIYELDVKQIEEAYPGLVDKIMNKVASLNEDAGADVYYATYDESGVYYKQGNFVPEHIDIYAGYEGNDAADDILIEQYDLSDVDTSGYQYVIYNNGIFAPKLCRVGCAKEGVQGSYYLRQIQSVYDAKEMWHESFWGVECMTYKDVRLGNEELTIIAIGTYNLLHEYGTALVIACVGLFAVALLTAFLISYVTYQRKQARYEIETYRRNTTNAMAHDLKSPLMAISAYAENLVNGVNPEKNTYYGEAILDTVHYMDQVIANILNLSKMESGALRLDKELVDIRELVEEHLLKYELIMKENALQITINGVCQQQCDRLWMTQLVDNLLSNAMKYAKDNSTIEINLQEEYFSITNQFEGNFTKIPEELMESFVKGDNVRSNNQGTGVGLAIVKNVAMAHGFDLEIQIENHMFVVKVNF